MQNTKISSKRLFIFAYLEGNATVTHQNLSLSEIYDTETDWEWQYAIQKNIDAVLDLQKNERMLIFFSRDNEDSSGFIKRIR